MAGGGNNAQTFLLLSNPSSGTASVRLRFVPPGTGTPIERTIDVAAGSRTTFWVNAEVPELAAGACAAAAVVTNGVPIVVERSTYWDASGLVWAAGTSSRGVPVSR